MKSEGLNDVSMGGLSSYGLTYMVLAHLQVSDTIIQPYPILILCCLVAAVVIMVTSSLLLCNGLE